MTIVPVAMTSGSGFTISGVDSNICTDNSAGGTWCYSDISYSITGLKYMINDVDKYTSAITSGSLYVSLRYSNGSPNTGNSFTITYDNALKIIIITLNQTSQAGDGNLWAGLNSTQTDPPNDQGTAIFYIDNATYTSIMESGVTKQALSGTATSGDKLQLSLGVSAVTTLLPPPPAYVRL